jgi:CDP-diacylglycerol---serine O-phosphatidyltransferase
VTDGWRIGANLATLANGLLGVGAVLYTLAGNKIWAMLLVAMGIGFDGLDGLLSRRSPRPPSSFGRVADSVADATTFGVAPAVMLAVHTSDAATWAPYATLTTAVAAAFLAAAVARLVYFTARAHGLPHFLGVPTPQSALAVIVVLLFHDMPGYAAVQPVGVLLGAAALATLMVVPVPYPKVRRGSPLRIPSAATAALAALALVPLQFRPAGGTPLAELAEVAAFGFLVGVGVYYVVGPFTVPGEETDGGRGP